MGNQTTSKGNRVTRSKVKRKNISADFETTTTRDDCRVWLWGACDIELDEEIDWDIDIASFFDYIMEFNSNCYFHNLKFDGGFILYWLFINGYMYTDEKGSIPGTFTAMISNMGQFYNITVYWENGNSTEFRDSLKKLPMPVKRIAQAFQLEEGKGDLDYHLHRPVGYKPTAEELDYLRRDVKIVAQAMRQILNSGMTRLTVASDSMAEFKRITGSKQFTRTFPELSYEMDAEIRRAYRGGFTYADPRFAGKLNGSGHVLDVNSLYPSVMRQRPLPYGVPTFSKGRVVPTESRPLTIFSVVFTAKLKPNHIPCIQIKGSSAFQPTQYLSDIPEPTAMMMTNVDFALYQDHYDMNVIEWGGGWSFHAAEGMFDGYIDKWAAVKENSKGGIREIAKLHLNSLYGKFASNPNVMSKQPELRDGVVRYVRAPDEIRAPVYTAAGVFITSYARDLTIRAAQENYDTFAYADTDSLHLLRDDIPDNIDIHPSRMGAWKHEYNFENSFYIRAKAYLELATTNECGNKESDHEHTIRCRYVNRIAGLPEAVSGPLTFDDVYHGHILEGKLSPVSVPGGIILENIPFELKL